jgi:hypothetical protein
MRWTALACLIVSSACSSPPPSPGTVRTRVAADLGHVLQQTKAAIDGSTANLPGARLFSLLALGALPRMPDLESDAMVNWLNEQVFADESSLGDGMFALPPQLACPPPIDPGCASRLAEAQLRVRVEQDDDGALRFAVQLDPQHDEPLSFLLSHDELAVSIDLDGGEAAMIALAEVAGGRDPAAMLQGEATADLKVLGPGHVTGALALDRPVAVAVAENGEPLGGDGAYRFASPAAQVAAIELDGNAALARLDLELGETIVHLPGDAGAAGTDVDLGGITAQLTLDRTATLAVQHASLGDKTTTVTRGGVPALAIDLDPDDGRAFDAAITPDDTLMIAPRIDFVQRIDHAALGDAPTVYDVMRVQLDGSLQPTANGDSVRVLTGALAVTTNPAAYGFSAAAGQCVAGAQVSSSTGTSYTRFTVASCR